MSGRRGKGALQSVIILESFLEEVTFQLGPLKNAQEGGVARP